MKKNWWCLHTVFNNLKATAFAFGINFVFKDVYRLSRLADFGGRMTSELGLSTIWRLAILLRECLLKFLSHVGFVTARYVNATGFNLSVTTATVTHDEMNVLFLRKSVMRTCVL